MKKTVALSLVFGLIFTAVALAQSGPARLPVERAGKIGAPLGQIAYVSNGDLYVMDWDGKNQFKVVTAENVDGKISWAPDGKRIAFTRKGKVELKGPDGLGGLHKVYDIFIAFIDSARAGNTNWWNRLTVDMGGRYPEWTADGSRIIFTNDLNANKVNADMPNYQTCAVDTTGEQVEIFRKDYGQTELFPLMPTVGPVNQYASVLYKKFNPVGLVITALDKPSLSDKEIGTSVKLLPKATAPAWSPDGQWIAYVDNDVANQGIYITTPDLSEKFLVFKPSVGQSLQTYPLSWSPDSKWITFGTTDGSLWIIDITGDGLKQLTGPGMNIAPAWSKHR